MENRIEVEKEIRESKKHEHFRYFAISLIGSVVPITIWGVNYGKIESPIWWGFFTVGMVLVTVTSLLFGIIKFTATTKALSQYQKVLNLYAVIDERTHVPPSAIVTTCLRPDMGRFGFQKINYYFWMDATELVFFPVRPEFATSKAYHVVQSIRLNEVMVRSYSLIGQEFDEGLSAARDSRYSIAMLDYGKSPAQPILRDTRATLIAYAFGEQTVYLVFDPRLHERMKVLIPLKDKSEHDGETKKEELPMIETGTETPPTLPES